MLRFKVAPNTSAFEARQLPSVESMTVNIAIVQRHDVG
jgi:hypothetical protein